ncbi:MAG: hypothetical protein KIT80_16100 [Chitinophagaceae bacterium]|nr:hypothetical protein [Chitinophagaceae bacterium]MCW5928439.1 hypothetical protein [Chitinophagaceae bacterium]
MEYSNLNQNLFENAAILVRLSQRYSRLLQQLDAGEITLMKYQEDLCRLQMETITDWDDKPFYEELNLSMKS